MYEDLEQNRYSTSLHRWGTNPWICISVTHWVGRRSSITGHYCDRMLPVAHDAAADWPSSPICVWNLTKGSDYCRKLCNILIPACSSAWSRFVGRSHGPQTGYQVDKQGPTDQVRHRALASVFHLFLSRRPRWSFTATIWWYPCFVYVLCTMSPCGASVAVLLILRVISRRVTYLDSNIYTNSHFLFSHTYASVTSNIYPVQTRLRFPAGIML